MEPTFTNSLGMEFVLIPAGTFRMGRNLPPGQEEAKKMIVPPADYVFGELFLEAPGMTLLPDYDTQRKVWEERLASGERQ